MRASHQFLLLAGDGKVGHDPACKAPLAVSTNCFAAAGFLKHALHSKAQQANSRTRGGFGNFGAIRNLHPNRRPKEYLSSELLFAFVVVAPSPPPVPRNLPALLSSSLHMHDMPLSAADKTCNFLTSCSEISTKQRQRPYDRSKVRLCLDARWRKTFHRGRSVRNNRNSSPWVPKRMPLFKRNWRHHVTSS